jgi:hypothetical protein
VLDSDIVSLDLLEGVGAWWLLDIGICLMSLKGLCSSEIDEFDAVVLIMNEVFSLLRKKVILRPRWEIPFLQIINNLEDLRNIVLVNALFFSLIEIAVLH